jgi:hypothetical protein
VIGEDNILTLTYHDFTTSWCMKINLYEVFCGIEYREYQIMSQIQMR